MPVRTLRVLQVNTDDVAGGAAATAAALHLGLREFGFDTHLAVGRRNGNLPDTSLIPNAEYAPLPKRALTALADRLPRRDERPLVGLARTVTLRVADPAREWSYLRGRENFAFHGTRAILDAARDFDIAICHNLHGQYFDIRALPELSRRVPTILYLQDQWLMTGHCSFSLQCERWQHGCGHCPDLSLYPAVRRDATAANWNLKADVYKRGAFHIGTPCEWLMEKVKRSSLSPALIEGRVIPNSADTATFRPDRRDEARQRLGILPGTRVVLYTANAARTSSYKDYSFFLRVARAARESSVLKEVLFICVGGGDLEAEELGVMNVPYVSSPSQIAEYYQAADVYFHAARAETHPLAIAEALSCGVPVVASAVGGIPEQIQSLEADGEAGSAHPTGMLFPPGDVAAAVRALEHLMADDDLRQSVALNARRDAVARFDRRAQVLAFADWIREIVGSSPPRADTAGTVT